MRKVLLTTIVALVLVGTITFAAFAAGNGWGQGPNQGFGPRFSESLNLSAEQQEKLLSIRQEFQKDTQSLRFDMQKKQLELRQLWAASSLNQTAIDAKNKEITAIRVQMVTKARAMQEKVKAILTPEQLKLLENKGFTPGAGFGRRHGGGRMGGCFGF